MTRADKWLMAGGLAMALVGLCAAALLVKLAIEAGPAPVPPIPWDGLP